MSESRPNTDLALRLLSEASPDLTGFSPGEIAQARDLADSIKGRTKCSSCYGRGWARRDGKVVFCSPCLDRSIRRDRRALAAIEQRGQQRLKAILAEHSVEDAKRLGLIRDVVDRRSAIRVGEDA